MASDVRELQKVLDNIAKITSHTFIGASDRKRALTLIRELAHTALTPRVDRKSAI